MGRRDRGKVRGERVSISKFFSKRRRGKITFFFFERGRERKEKDAIRIHEMRSFL